MQGGNKTLLVGEKATHGMRLFPLHFQKSYNNRETLEIEIGTTYPQGDRIV